MGTSAAAAEAAMTGSRAGKSQAAFRTISEVADELDVAQHVLRFWESKFPQVRPLKRGGGRRYYRPEDIELLREIRTLLYGEGYTIKGAQKLLRQRRAKPAPAAKAAEQPVEQPSTGTAARAEAAGPTAAAGSAPSEPAPTEPAPVEIPPAEQPSGAPEPVATTEPPSSQPGAPRPPVTADLERLQALRRLMSEMRQELDAALAADD